MKKMMIRMFMALLLLFSVHSAAAAAVVDAGQTVDGVYYEEVFEDGIQPVSGAQTEQVGLFSPQEFYPSGLLEVSVSNPLVRVGQDNSVTITVTQDGLPQPGKTVYIKNVAYGPTDASGQVTLALTPADSGMLDISVDGIHFFAKMAAIKDNEGVVQVSAKDRQGYSLTDFAVYVHGTYRVSSLGLWGDQFWIVASEGINDVVVTKKGQTGEAGYYLYRTVNVTPGQVNAVVLDGSLTSKVDLSFSYDSNPILNADVYVDLVGMDWPDFGNSLASRTKVGVEPLSGEQTVYVTPGTYSVFFKGENQAGDLLYVGRPEVDLKADYAGDFNWTEADTGVLNFSTSLDSAGSFGGKKITFGDRTVDFGAGSSVRMDLGTYVVQGISVTDNSENVVYEYTKDAAKRETLVLGESETAYSVDLSLDGLYLGNSNLFLPQPILRAAVNTVSGYQIKSIDRGYGLLDAVITDSNGLFNVKTNYFEILQFFSINAHTGHYELAVTGDLGPFYGDIEMAQNITIYSAPQVTVSPWMIPINETTEVTISVTDAENNPVPGQEICLDDQVVGTTNSEGLLTVPIERQQVSNPVIRLGALYFSKKLRVIDFATMGGIEVSAVDSEGAPIKNYTVGFFWGGLILK